MRSFSTLINWYFFSESLLNKTCCSTDTPESLSSWGTRVFFFLHEIIQIVIYLEQIFRLRVGNMSKVHELTIVWSSVFAWLDGCQVICKDELNKFPCIYWSWKFWIWLAIMALPNFHVGDQLYGSKGGTIYFV